MMLSYPIMLDLTKKRVVVVGGGKKSSKVLATLVGAGAYIRIVSNEIPEEYKFLNSIQKIDRNYEKGDIDRAFLVFICTDNPDVRRDVYDDLEKGQLVFDYDQEAHSDFYPLRIDDTNLISDEEVKEVVISSIEDVSNDEADVALKKVIEKNKHQLKNENDLKEQT